MSKTQLIEVDEETADRLRSRAAGKGISVSELVAELAVESGSLAFDPDDIAELDRRWAAVQTTGAVPNEENAGLRHGGRPGFVHGVIDELVLLVAKARNAPTDRKNYNMNDRPGPPVRDMTPEEVARGMAEGRIMLVDVREPNEIAAESIPGAIDLPMSAFDLDGLPDPGGREVVFTCRSGNRSVRASQIAQAQGLPYKSHLAGGILAWKAAGLPTES